MNRRLAFLLLLFAGIALAAGSKQWEMGETPFNQAVTFYERGGAITRDVEMLGMIGGNPYTLTDRRGDHIRFQNIEGVAFSQEGGRASIRLLCGYTTPGGIGPVFGPYGPHLKCTISFEGIHQIDVSDFSPLDLSEKGDACYFLSTTKRICLRKTEQNDLFFIQVNHPTGEIQLAGYFWR